MLGESKTRLTILLAISAALASATCDGASNPAQTEDGPGHNAGADCQECHGQFSMAGTVFATSVGRVPQPDVPVFLTGFAGNTIILDPSNGDGNLVSGGIPPGPYLITLSGQESRSWHVLPDRSNCNRCHMVGAGNGGVTLPPLHTRLPGDNDCTHCHHFPATMASGSLVPPGVLNVAVEAPVIPGSQVQILDRTWSFDPAGLGITTVRPVIFAPGYFSMFDAILAVAARNGVDIQYHYDESRKAHFIDSIDGEQGDFWYHFSYDTGGSNSNELRNRRAYRWDEALWRPGVWIQVVEGENLDEIKAEYLEEIQRETAFGHLIPQVSISINPSPYQGNPPQSHRITVTREFTNVLVTPHDLRSGAGSAPYSTPFQPGVVTSLDILLSLKDQGALTLVTSVFYTRFAGNFLDSHYVVALGFPQEGTAHASGRQGFVYVTNNGTPQRLPNDAGRTFHMTSDISVVHAPDFSRWRWIELGNPYYEAEPTLSQALAQSVREDHDAVGRGFNLHRPMVDEMTGRVALSYNLFELNEMEIRVMSGAGDILETIAVESPQALGIHKAEWNPPPSLGRGSETEKELYLSARMGSVTQTRRVGVLGGADRGPKPTTEELPGWNRRPHNPLPGSS